MTARNVADAIGYSPGTLYNIFENLDDMIVHLNGITLDDLHDLLAAKSLTGDPTEDIKQLFDGYLGYLEQHPNLWRLLFEFNLPESRELPEWYRRKVSKVLGLVEAALVPLFSADNIEHRNNMARIVWAMLFLSSILSALKSNFRCILMSKAGGGWLRIALSGSSD